MTKHRSSRRRNQKGGAWYNPVSWFGSSTPEDPNAPKKSVLDSVTGAASSVVSSANDLVGNAATGITSGAQSAWNSTTNMLSTNVDLTSSTPTSTQPTAIQPVEAQQPQPVSMGGRNRRRGRTMKGGKGGLTYYAAPVSGLKVAEPTTWLHYANGTNQYSTKGGSKRSVTRRGKSRGRKSRKIRRHKKH